MSPYDVRVQAAETYLVDNGWVRTTFRRRTLWFTLTWPGLDDMLGPWWDYTGIATWHPRYRHLVAASEVGVWLDCKPRKSAMTWC